MTIHQHQYDDGDGERIDLWVGQEVYETIKTISDEFGISVGMFTQIALLGLFRMSQEPKKTFTVTDILGLFVDHVPVISEPVGAIHCAGCQAVLNKSARFCPKCGRLVWPEGTVMRLRRDWFPDPTGH
jgi:hypothetical protein